MTPSERARQIDKEEFAAECAAVRQRALQYAAHYRQEERKRFEASLNKEPVKFIRRKWIEKPKPAPMPLAVKPAAKQLAVKPPKIKTPKAAKERKVAVIEPQRFTIDGLTLSRQEWADHLGISYNALAVRAGRYGSLEVAVRLDVRRRERVTVAGKSMTVTEWADYIGMSRSTLYRRVKIAGNAEAVIADLLINPPAVLTYGTNPSKSVQTYTHDGKTLTLTQWQTITGINQTTIGYRLKHGWSIADALTTPLLGRPGVSSDFAPSNGTGGGSALQESPEITFSEKVENA